MAKKANKKPPTAADEALKRQKKQARQEAKLMLEIEVSSLIDQIIASPQVEAGIDALPSETETPNSFDEEQTPPAVEKVTPSEDIVAPQDGTEIIVVDDQETAIASDTSHPKTTPVKANA